MFQRRMKLFFAFLLFGATVFVTTAVMISASRSDLSSGFNSGINPGSNETGLTDTEALLDAADPRNNDTAAAASTPLSDSHDSEIQHPTDHHDDASNGTSLGSSNATVIEKTKKKSKPLFNQPFRHLDFVATREMDEVSYNLTTPQGVIFRLSLDNEFREATSYYGDMVLYVNASGDGVTVLVTDGNYLPLSLKSSVKTNRYLVRKAFLDKEGLCLLVHIIPTGSPCAGVVSIYFKEENQGLAHLYIIISVIFGFILVGLLVRQCANHLLRSVNSYDPMAEGVVSLSN